MFRSKISKVLGIALCAGMVAMLIANGVVWAATVGPQEYVTSATTLGLKGGTDNTQSYIDGQPALVKYDDTRYDWYWTIGSLVGGYHTRMTKTRGPLNNPTEYFYFSNKEQWDYINMNGYAGAPWINHIYKMDDGSLLGIVHLEYADGSNVSEMRIGLARSTDGGSTWTYLGHIIKQRVSGTQGDNGNIQGSGYAIAGSYMYIWYLDYDGSTRNSAVARSPLSDVVSKAKNGQVGNWYKYYNGSWDEPGIGGRFTPNNQWIGGHTAVSWNSYLNKFIASGGYLNSVDLYQSDDGVTWTHLVQVWTHNKDTPYHMMVTPGWENAYTGQILYDYYAFDQSKYYYRHSIDLGSGGGLPSPWQTQDIGAVAATGSASYSNGVFTVKGSGADIWGTADEFRFVYQTLSGDGQITARVTGVQNTNAWAKAGVMIRETLEANSKHAMMVLTPGNGLAFQRRTSTGGESSHTSGGSASAPYWVRVVRSGNTFTAYKSSDGNNWTQVGSETISMASNVYVGLAVTSHNDGTLCQATFDNVSVSGGGGGTPVPAKIEAENYTSQSGTITYNSGSASNGKYVGDFNGSDYTEYNVNVPTAGSYTIEFRVASLNTNTQLQLKNGQTVLATVDVGNTGGWESWVIVSKAVNLSAGQQTWRLQNSGSGNYPNIDYFEVKSGGATNLVGNPGFETGSLSPWTSYGGASVVNSNVRSGTYAAQVGTNVAAVEQVITGLSPNTAYVLTGWIKTSATSVQGYIGVKDFGGNETAQSSNSTSYTQLTVNFTTGPSNTSAKIYCYKSTSSGYIYCDDFSVTRAQ